MEILQALTLEHFEEMRRLEMLYYPAEYIAPAEEAFRWYLHDPCTTRALSDGKQIVGFINLFPVKPEIFAALMQGTFNDSALTVEGIEDRERPSRLPMQLFLSCVAVHPDYRAVRPRVSEQLMKAAIEQYQPYAKYIQWVITDNVTPAGRRFSERYGFTRLKESDHQSTLYVQTYEALVKKIP